jgi:N-acetyl-gamma-glutamyl-phosphate reductase
MWGWKNSPGRFNVLRFHARRDEPGPARCHMLRVGIIGATGYSGLELVRLLLDHPQAKVTYATSRTYAGRDLNEVFPALKGHCNLKCEEFKLERAAELCDFLFVCLPHGLSEELVPKLAKAGKKVVDIGSDFRLDDLTQYETWYKRKALRNPDFKPVYGLAELNGDKVRGASVVANPGCYPTATILALAPLVEKNLVERKGVIVDAKTGVSGSGRSLALASLYSETTETIKAYKVGVHQHTPEIEQELTKLTNGEPVVLNLTTHLAPMNRGILATCYGRLKEKKTTKELLDLYRSYYLEEPFVQVMPEGVYPGTREVYGSNSCMIGLKVDERVNTVIVLSAIDNLTKGAAGQAIQNMNLMCGFEETMGLPRVGLIP